jgi:hypothetical protein
VVEIGTAGEQGGVGDAEAVQGGLQWARRVRCLVLAVVVGSVLEFEDRAGWLGRAGDSASGGEYPAGCAGGLGGPADRGGGLAAGVGVTVASEQ